MKHFRAFLFLLFFILNDDSNCVKLIGRRKRTIFLTSSPCTGSGLFGQKTPVSQASQKSSINSQIIQVEETNGTKMNQSSQIDAKVRVKRVITITLGAPLGGSGCGGGCDGGCGGGLPPFSRYRFSRRRKSENLQMDPSASSSSSSSASSGLNEEKKRVKYMVIPSPFLTSLLTMGRVGIPERQPLVKKSNRFSRQSTTRIPSTTNGPFAFV